MGPRRQSFILLIMVMMLMLILLGVPLYTFIVIGHLVSYLKITVLAGSVLVFYFVRHSNDIAAAHWTNLELQEPVP
jgi:hypothetical protein